MEAVMRAPLQVLAALLLALAALAVAPECAAQAEQQVKSAFIYKFAGYVEWPESAFAKPDTPFLIAVLGDEPVAAELEQAVVGRTINDRRIVVRRAKVGESFAGVHILFVGKAETARLGAILQGASPQPILTVTESEGALAQGSVINFVVAERRVRFEISLPSAERSRLKLSSRLLAVAAQVRTGTP
jgi:hypothetical protein